MITKSTCTYTLKYFDKAFGYWNEKKVLLIRIGAAVSARVVCDVCESITTNKLVVESIGKHEPKKITKLSIKIKLYML